MDTITRHYLKACLFTDTDGTDENTGGEPLDRNYSISDFSSESVAKATADCEKFFQENEKDLILVSESEAYQGLADHEDNEGGGWHALVGHDFWLSRNGHGTGFFDRAFNDKPGIEEAFERLQDAAESFGGVWSTVGDDGEIHLS
jgi:hypothetical protein